MAPASGPRRRVSVARHLRAAATERLPVKATAIFLAVVLWMVVEGEEPAQDVVDVRLELVLDSNLVLISARPQIKAQVIGPARELLQLAAVPPEVFVALNGNVGDSVTLELHPDEVRLPQAIEDARVVAVEPRLFTLYFDSLLQRTVPVRSALIVTNTAGVPLAVEPTFEPESVLVTGRRRTVQQLESIATARRRVEVRDTTVVEVPLDTLHLGVVVSPSRVRARIAVPRAPGGEGSGSARP